MKTFILILFLALISNFTFGYYTSFEEYVTGNGYTCSCRDDLRDKECWSTASSDPTYYWPSGMSLWNDGAFSKTGDVYMAFGPNSNSRNASTPVFTFTGSDDFYFFYRSEDNSSGVNGLEIIVEIREYGTDNLAETFTVSAGNISATYNQFSFNSSFVGNGYLRVRPQNLGYAHDTYLDDFFCSATYNSVINTITCDGLNNDPDPLPVSLGGFDATLRGNEVNLSWFTYQEVNNDYFEIQSSSDGKQFQTIGSVKGNGTTNKINRYNFTVYIPSDKMVYFRLVQYDYDGNKSTYESLGVKPQPDSLRDDDQIEAYDVRGKRLYSGMYKNFKSLARESQIYFIKGPFGSYKFRK